MCPLSPAPGGGSTCWLSVLCGQQRAECHVQGQLRLTSRSATSQGLLSADPRASVGPPLSLKGEFRMTRVVVFLRVSFQLIDPSLATQGGGIPARPGGWEMRPSAGAGTTAWEPGAGGGGSAWSGGGHGCFPSSAPSGPAAPAKAEIIHVRELMHCL